ncbi:MAG: type II secretion system F family protein, partial [Candidatus Woesearchaeota archaeon]|nr:type II secretion system F family protein [Candidatus Woesearchaeota archaeon]
TIIFFILYNPIYLSILKGLGIGLAASISSFTFFYSYPALEVKRRIRSIKANMPFAVNHMAAVSAAGTPPITIFNLIAKTKEYEEISREFEKIVDYIEVFGFDSTTAIRAVSSTTPYPEFKEMLEGLVSAIQSGADTKAFLKQKSSESMNSYRLELQKYNETLTTYSDIYTGVLIAAPLFFVITLTLVNLLGGKVGGLNITTVMLLGTYMIIPGLNIIFLLFLQASQPEV